MWSSRAWGRLFDLSLFSDGELHTGEGAFWNLLDLAQALGKQPLANEVQITLVASGLHGVLPEDRVTAAKALALGPCRVIPEEYPHAGCRTVDLPVEEATGALASLLIHEITTEAPAVVVAYRDGMRWTQTFEPVQLKETAGDTALLRKNGVYVVTGGLGGIGLTLARHLAKSVQARLVLIGRSAPDEAKTRAVREMEAAGAEVMVAAGDVRTASRWPRL